MKEGNHRKIANCIYIIPSYNFPLHDGPLYRLGIVLEDGYDIWTPQELLGHNDIRTTII